MINSKVICDEGDYVCCNSCVDGYSEDTCIHGIICDQGDSVCNG